MPIFMYELRVVARAEQHPDRQHRGDEAVGGHRDDDLLRARA